MAKSCCVKGCHNRHNREQGDEENGWLNRNRNRKPRILDTKIGPSKLFLQQRKAVSNYRHMAGIDGRAKKDPSSIEKLHTKLMVQ